MGKIIAVVSGKGGTGKTSFTANVGLALAALGWAASFEDAQQLAMRFAAVARDGKITSNELPAVDAIRRKAVELRRVMEETVLAIDKAMAQMEGRT